MSKQAEFRLSAFDIATQHEKGYIVDKTVIRDHYVIMCFKTPFTAYTANGFENGDAGSILINSPGFREYHTNQTDAKTGFCNSWMHCKGEFVKDTLEKYNIPLNVILKTKSAFLFDPFLKTVQAEQMQAQAFYEEVIRNDFERLIIDLARQLCIIQANDRQYYIELLKIRQQMTANIQEKLTLEDLAKKANLSPSRFSHLYKEFFGVSPIDDLLKIRLRTAEKLLITTTMRIETIALECGFSSAAYFSKMFKLKIGCSPSQFRNS